MCPRGARWVTGAGRLQTLVNRPGLDAGSDEEGAQECESQTAAERSR
jgi:hypothetical protein